MKSLVRTAHQIVPIRVHFLALTVVALLGIGCNCDCGPCEQLEQSLFNCFCESGPIDEFDCRSWQTFDENNCSCPCTDADLFAQLNCNGHGNGVLNSGACSCDCDPGWCGTNCDVEVTPCASGEIWSYSSCECVCDVACLNGGTPLPDCSCDCPDGTYGPDCGLMLPADGYLVATLVNTTIGDTFVFISDLQGVDEFLGFSPPNGWSAQVEHAADPTNRLFIFHFSSSPVLDTTTYSFPENLGSDVVIDRPGWPPATPGGQSYPQMESGSIRYVALPTTMPGVSYDVRFNYGITSNGVHIEVINGRCFQPL